MDKCINSHYKNLGDAIPGGIEMHDIYNEDCRGGKV